ncbi:MAG: hypothetical protein WB460_10235, partial [Candidatus Acidiferrales bacterium]
DLTSLHALLTDQQEAFWQWIRFAQLALTLQSTPTPTLRTDWGRYLAAPFSAASALLCVLCVEYGDQIHLALKRNRYE